MDEDTNLASQFPVSNQRTDPEQAQATQSRQPNNPHLSFTDVDITNMKAGLQQPGQGPADADSSWLAEGNGRGIQESRSRDLQRSTLKSRNEESKSNVMQRAQIQQIQ